MLRKALFAFHSIGIKAALNTLVYAIQRDRLEKTSRTQELGTKPLHPLDPLPLKSITDGFRLPFRSGMALEVVFLSPETVRFTWTPGSLPPPYALTEEKANPGPLSLEQQGTVIRLASDRLECLVSPDGSVEFRSNGKSLKTFYPPKLQGSQWLLRSSLHPEEAIYGLGERAARLNLRGGTYRFWNTDPNGSYGAGTDPLYLGIPVYLGLTLQGGYLVFHENPAKGEIAFDSPHDVNGYTQASFENGALRTFFIAGAPPEVLAAYTRLTGRAPLPPRWALGYHHCKWGHKTEAKIREIVKDFQEHRLPLDAIHLDIDYMEGFRVFTVDTTRFPDLPRLSADLHTQGVRLVTILDPGVKCDPDYEIYQEGLDGHYFSTLPNGRVAQGQVWPGWSAFPDFTHPQTRQWWGSLYPRLLDQGVDGFWHDMNEPSAFSAWGDPTLPLPTRHALEGEGASHAEAHNLYGLLMNRAGFEGLRAARPTRRPWLVSRSGWAGMQRYAWNWTADVESSWEALRMTIAEMLGLGLSGIPFTGSDIGGFSGTPDAELYTRWFQMAAFTPFFRTHAAVMVPPREPWLFGEPTLSTIRKFLEIRQHLEPYLYTLAWEANQTGVPLLRPLFWNHPELSELRDVDDSFCLGDALLIAPVLNPGQTSRQVLLPPGLWYDFWTGSLINETTRSPQSLTLITARASYDQIPVFVRGGSILPFAEGERIELKPYPDEQGKASGTLYEDAGDGYGPYRLTHYTLHTDSSGPHLAIRTEGDYTP